MLVLEREFLGFGASGRNGGLLSPVPAPVWLLTARSNPDHAWALATLNRKVHALGAWLADKVPDSEASQCTLQLQAAGRFSASGIGRVAAVLERAGIDHDLAPDSRRNGKPTLRLATFAVSPYKLVRALGAYAAGLGAHICERAAVAAVEVAPGGAIIRLAGGRTLRARKVVLCTNAYTGSISTPSAPCSKVVRNYMLATEPLDRETQQRLGDGHTFVVELNRSYTFYRLHRARIIFGGIETFFRRPQSDYDVPASIRSALERNLAKSLPWCRQLQGRVRVGRGIPILRHRPADHCPREERGRHRLQPGLRRHRRTAHTRSSLLMPPLWCSICRWQMPTISASPKSCVLRACR